MQAAAKRGMISKGNVVQACVVYAAIVADVFVTAYTDPLQTTEVLTHMLLLGYVQNGLCSCTAASDQILATSESCVFSC